MISAVDSSVILDVLSDDPDHATASERLLRETASKGQLVICECVLAEIYPALGDAAVCEQLLADWQIDFVASSRQSATVAGAHFARHLARGGRQGRVVADFLIAAHAQTHADRLLARDRGYLRDYFDDLVVVDPSRS
ncbi:MAG: type II toxin-antitoxin system VapC family toxin [Gemmatimonadetes bacterium]|jgi:predicted nucleic acid-binding protein|nr:type II toxin-antitoxin system VapC family toxin [Gemmatimonadota bacterium]MBT6146869.1 type II toxin-antitoxin system VapC family toxin [Gemmatimonadota bacterium]MBT7862900.1 type II toxin-antitoxin system VapC family toxin [Gemmatimonadota bacterium]